MAKITAKDVLGSLFNADEIVCIRVFDDRKDSAFSGAKLSCECGKFSGIEETLKKHNEQNRGIFFVVNYGGQKDEEITRINAQFVESDTLSFSEMEERIDAFPLAPSMIIKTAKSLHTYWFMKDADVGRFRVIQKQLVKHFDGDPMCVNESRVMRLPGFNHCKAEPVMVECISFHPERKYTQDQLAEVLPTAEEEHAVEVKKGTERGLDVVLHECEFIKHCKSDSRTLSEHDWYAMISNLAVFDGGTELIHSLSEDYPGYSYEDTQKKINHFLDSGTRPMMCRTIAEKGFSCPRLESGECSCRSPAAMCYQPMSMDTLMEIAGELTVKGDLTKDVKAATEFVENYLYNQDAATTEALIGVLKEKFHFKSNMIQPLKSIYREASKKYKSGLKARMHKTDDELPLWYVPTEAGLKFLPGVLAASLAETENVIYSAEQHYIYQSGVYREMSEMEAQRMVQMKMIPEETKMAQITDAEKQWRLHIRKDIKDLNANPYIINVKNGLYNVLEDTLTEHTPDNYSTVQLNVNYDRDADCPMFIKFLEESMGGDMEQVRLLQQMLGYFLIPVNNAQKCFVIVGAAGAGKSVLLRVLNELLLGKENVSNVSWQALNERFKPAELFGKLANIFADLPTKNIDDNGIFKALVGEDFLTVEKKNRNPFSFQSTARLLFSCNSIPKNYGDRSEGFYRRLIIIRFSHTVPEERRDTHLIDKFRTEADGIFLYAMEGLRSLLDQDFHFSETDVNRQELQTYREESDSVLSFVKEECELDESYETGSTDLYNRYKSYCEESGLKPYSHKKFIQNLVTDIGLEKSIDGTGRRRTVKGIRTAEMLG